MCQALPCQIIIPTLTKDLILVFLNTEIITKMISQKICMRIKFMAFQQQSIPALQILFQEDGIYSSWVRRKKYILDLFPKEG